VPVKNCFSEQLRLNKMIYLFRTSKKWGCTECFKIVRDWKVFFVKIYNIRDVNTFQTH